MANPKKEKLEKPDQAKGDEVLRRLLKTPHKPHVPAKQAKIGKGRREGKVEK
jgi:hypothetical protein